jgi:hypothetical protein
MRNPLLRRAMGCTTLAIASGEISFGDQPPARLMTREECRKQAREGEECSTYSTWFFYNLEQVSVGAKAKVTLQDRAGNTRTGTGTFGANTLNVNVAPLSSPGDRTSDARGAGFGPGFGVSGGYGEWKLPAGAGGLGIRFTTGSPGSERFITLAAEDYEGESVGAQFRIPSDSLERRLAFYGALLNEQFDADESDTFAASADGRGVAHQVENAPSGSTGLAFPTSTPLDTRVSNEIESWSAEFGGLLLPGDNGFSWGLGLRYRRTTQDLFNEMTTATFPGIFANMSEEVEDEYLSVPLTLQKGWNSTGTVRPHVFLQIAPGFYRSELSGTYEFACNLCPGPDQAFQQAITDEDDGFTWEGAGGVGVDVYLDRVAMGLYARYRHFDHMSYADNRESPLDDPVRLGEDSASGWVVGFNIGLEFNY